MKKTNTLEDKINVLRFHIHGMNSSCYTIMALLNEYLDKSRITKSGYYPDVYDDRFAQDFYEACKILRSITKELAE